MVTEICELCRKKVIAIFTAKNLYQQKNKPQEETIESIQEWVSKKNKEREEKCENIEGEEDINVGNGNNIIDNNDKIVQKYSPE